MNKKQLFLWSLYDFANSLIYINFTLYFAQWIVVDKGLSDLWYNVIFAVTTVILLFTAPTLAAKTDLRGGRKKLVNISTVGTFLGYGGVTLLAFFDGNVWLAALLFLVGQYFYQLSFVFYNPLLEDIADPEHRSRASGIGQFASSIGFVVGIVMTLPFSDSRILPLAVSMVFFFILSIPFMIYFKESAKERITNQEGSGKTFLKKMTVFFLTSAAAPMLVAFFFFNDALVTVSNNYSIYLERVFDVSDQTKSILLVAVLATSALGGVIAGWVGDRIGALKTLKIILIAWVIALPLVAISPNLSAMFVFAPATGFLLGSVWTVTRSYLTMVLPKKDLGYGFSFYTIAERFATFVGPITWGGIVTGLGTESFAYRLAMGSMAVFMALGLLILHFWRKEVKQ